MIIKTKGNIPSHAITDPLIFKERRKIIKSLLTLTSAGMMPASVKANNTEFNQINALQHKLSDNTLTPTPINLVKNYTNYYEFTFEKEPASQLAQALQTNPWSVEISGAVEQPGSYYLEDILQHHPLQERIYRFRCVEAWSMVVPWLGFPLSDLIKSVKPLSTAKFVKFTSIYQPKTMPNQRRAAMLQWPYIEALRIDEAIHPLTILAVGMYGASLPKQNGAPLRLVVPWKYGFKSIKAIVKIELLEKPPQTTWNKYAPNEYGFYANVNPAVAHPRWSQSSERLLGSHFFTPRRQTELFNGYGEQVASLYSDMNLKHFF